MSWFSFLGGSSSKTEMIDIYPIPISERDFVSIDVQNIYTRILTDVLERTQGIPEDAKNLLWDNCLASEKQDGLVTMVAKAMVGKSDLFLVYIKGLKVIRKADPSEEAQIRADYKAKGESSVGVYLTFKNYGRTDMVKFYSQLEYCSVGGLWKQGNISKAIQLKFSDLRGSVSLGDSAETKTQAQAIATGLSQGKDIMLDAKDTVETAKPDMAATTAAMDFIAQKRSFYLGMPATYLTGEASKGLGDSGKGDSKATERGLKGYYFSIGKPVIEGIFGVKTTFKSEDTEGLETALKVVETFDRTSDEHLSKDNKTLIVNKAFGLDESEVGDEPDPNDRANQPPAAIDPKTGKPVVPPGTPPTPPPKA